MSCSKHPLQIGPCPICHWQNNPRRLVPVEHRNTWGHLVAAAQDDIYLHNLVTVVEMGRSKEDALIEAVLALAKNNKELRDLATEYLTNTVPRILIYYPSDPLGVAREGRG